MMAYNGYVSVTCNTNNNNLLLVKIFNNYTVIDFGK